MPQSNQTIQLTDALTIKQDGPLSIIAGPCQIESESHCLMMAEKIKEVTDELGYQLIFKASYDKANRTSLAGARGVGMQEGLNILAKVKEKFNVPVISDVHTAEQCQIAAEVLDVIQIPAFLCRQTDMLIAAGETGKVINLKKGQFLAAADLEYAAQKIASTGNQQILLCERGTCFGYRDLIVDFRNFQIMEDLGYPVVYDATHSVMQMGGANGKSTGSRKYVHRLSKAAVAFGVSTLFLEVHDDPDNAPSDGPNMLNLEQFKNLLTELKPLALA